MPFSLPSNIRSKYCLVPSNIIFCDFLLDSQKQVMNMLLISKRQSQKLIPYNQQTDYQIILYLWNQRAILSLPELPDIHVPLKECSIIQLYQDQSQKNGVMKISMKKVLTDFYCNIISTHKQSSQKIKALDHFFSRFHKCSEGITALLKQNKKSEYETLASIGEIQPFSFNSPMLNFVSSSMLYTFLLSDESPSANNQDQICSKVISHTAFTNFSFLKVLLFAIFVNFLHIKKHNNFGQENKYLSRCHSVAQHTLKKVKIAMVTAAQSIKVLNKKKYTKIRYLYDQLTNYSQKAINSSEKYIKLIIEDFDDQFINKTFDKLKSKSNQLFYSKSLYSSGQLQKDSLGVEDFLHENKRVLEYLKLKLVLTRKGKKIDLGSDQELNIVIEEMPNYAFKLKQIISVRNPQQCYFQ